MCSVQQIRGEVIRTDQGVRFDEDCTQRCFLQMSDDCVGFASDTFGSNTGFCTYYKSITYIETGGTSNITGREFVLINKEMMPQMPRPSPQPTQPSPQPGPPPTQPSPQPTQPSPKPSQPSQPSPAPAPSAKPLIENPLIVFAAGLLAAMLLGFLVLSAFRRRSRPGFEPQIDVELS